MEEALPTAVLVLRIWAEDGDGRLRARVMATPDIATKETTTFVTFSSEAVLAMVASFLADFQTAGPVT